MDQNAAPETETFAVYLAKQLIAKRNGMAGVVAPAVPLTDGCDIAVTLPEGPAMTIVCIVDGEADPQRRFGLWPEEVDRAARACLDLPGNPPPVRGPVGVTIVEVGARPVTDADKARLSSFDSGGIFSKVVTEAFRVDTVSGEVWTGAGMRARNMRRFIERLLRAPRAAEDAVRAPEPAAMHGRVPPVLTLGLLFAFLAVYGLELALGIGRAAADFEPGLDTLVALGGLNGNLVLGAGEWFRLFSAPLLHAHPLHLLNNCIVLFFVGSILEKLVGRWWLAALFAVGALGGSLMSLAINPPVVVSVGASGGIMGLLAAGIVVSRRLPPALRRAMTINLGVMLALSLLPITVTAQGDRVDFAAHLGGAIFGAIPALLLYFVWSRQAPTPPFRPVASALAAAGLAAIVWAAASVAGSYEEHRLASFVIPSHEMPDNRDEALARSQEFVLRYPRDPRARMWQALALWPEDPAAAATTIRQALADTEMLNADIVAVSEADLRAILAGILVDMGRIDEARRAAALPCRSRTDDMIVEALRRNGLCE